MAAEFIDAWMLMPTMFVAYACRYRCECRVYDFDGDIVSILVDDFLAVHLLFHVLVVGCSTLSGSLVLVHLFGQEVVDVVL